MEVKVLGAIIGTASGWDQMDTAEFVFYDFFPNDLGNRFLGKEKLGTDLFVNYETGQVYTQISYESLSGDTFSTIKRDYYPIWSSLKI